eukprot:2081604-Rhodomonas_salina.2
MRASPRRWRTAVVRAVQTAGEEGDGLRRDDDVDTIVVGNTDLHGCDRIWTHRDPNHASANQLGLHLLRSKDDDEARASIEVFAHGKHLRQRQDVGGQRGEPSNDDGSVHQQGHRVDLRTSFGHRNQKPYLIKAVRLRGCHGTESAEFNRCGG